MADQIMPSADEDILPADGYPRMCAVPDSIVGESLEARWGRLQLRWTLTGLLRGFDEPMLSAAFREAWGYWEAVCGITATYIPAAGDADVRSGTGAIDGAGRTLAWSELPNGSDRPLKQLYDVGETWVVSETPGGGQIDLVRVACHEIGHALGLGHDTAGSNALMAPMYSPSIRRPTARDVARIQKLYGPPKPVPTPPAPPDRVAEMQRAIDEAAAALDRVRTRTT